MTFSDKIKRSRQVVGLTQQELADQVGVSKRTIASYECTDAVARRSNAVQLARALKVFSLRLSCGRILPARMRRERNLAARSESPVYRTGRMIVLFYDNTFYKEG